MENQELLVTLLKKKGIGPESSKSLKEEDIDALKILFRNEETSLITRATLLTALLTLPPTKIEKEFIDQIQESPSEFLPTSLLPFLNEENGFQKTINQVIKHNDLSFEEANEAIQHLFDTTSDHLKGAFLEAERLKRETFEENSAFFEVMRSHVQEHKSELPLLIDIGDSYDGCNRIPSLNLFTAVLLGAAGYPTYLHGVDEVAPKEGVTHHQILNAASKNPLKSTDEVRSCLENKEIGWAYLDQKIYHPELYALKQVRKEMVKRPFLATFEKMLQPIVAKKNYLVTQYTHKHYKYEIAKLTNKYCKFDKTLHIKGMEGTCMINPKIPAECVLIDASISDVLIDGSLQGITESLSRKEVITPELCLSIGLDILNDKDIPEKQFILFQAATYLHYLFNEPYNKSFELLKELLSSKKALSHWNKY